MKLRPIIILTIFLFFIILIAADSNTHAITQNAIGTSLPISNTFTPASTSTPAPILTATKTPIVISPSIYYIAWMIVSSLSLVISIFALSRTLWKDRVRLRLLVHTGMLYCRYPRDSKPRPHLVAFSEITNLGYVSTSITEIGLFAFIGNGRNRMVDGTVHPCFHDKEGEIFASKSVLPGESFNAWIHPKRVEGFQILMEEKYPNMEIELGVFAIAANGRKFLAYFTEDDLFTCQKIMLPDEHDTQPDFLFNYPPTSYQLRNQSPPVFPQTNEIHIKDLDLSDRVFLILQQAGIMTVDDVLAILKKDDQVVKFSEAFGKKTLNELRLKMRKKGYLKD